ncbi:MAG: hypothetical protein EOO16_12705 [Chitinophagaceae bacterium]|nr:MAG: hypothetical protein EOO16_12705 [Chitinophagaceae bacterium]
MNYAVVLFFDDSPAGYTVSDNGEQVRFQPAPHPYGLQPRTLPELTARPASDGWLVEGTDDPSVRIQVGRLLGQRNAPLAARISVAP